MQQLRDAAAEEKRMLRPELDAEPAGAAGDAVHVKTHYVAIARTAEIAEARSKLPIIGMEQEIMEAVMHNNVIVLSGETGCGKTTQVHELTCSQTSFCCNHLENDNISRCHNSC